MTTVERDAAYWVELDTGDALGVQVDRVYDGQVTARRLGPDGQPTGERCCFALYGVVTAERIGDEDG